jgi:cytochrome c-type biogenesis protein CcmH
MRAPWLALLILATAPAWAVQPGEMLKDPVLEERARDLSKQIRCLVCQNESIDSSNADLARDLRILVRDRLKAGDSNKEVLNFLVARYGDFVLLKPPIKPGTYLLWFGPAAILALGGIAIAFLWARRRQAGQRTDPLTNEERLRLDRLLRDHDAS